MNSVKNLVRNEPVVSAAVITGIVGGILRLLIAFGIDITSEQVEAIVDLVTLLAPIVGALIARRFVYSQKTVDSEFTHDDSVVEYELDGHVLAGEANELPTNTHVREVGELDESV